MFSGSHTNTPESERGVPLGRSRWREKVDAKEPALNPRG
jgi:hypothetical protein